MIVDDRKLRCEEVSQQQHRPDPAERSEDVVGDERRVAHVGGAGDDRREGPDDRHELCHDDRLAAMLLVEIVRANQMRALEESRVFADEQRPILPPGIELTGILAPLLEALPVDGAVLSFATTVSYRP